MKTKEKTSTRNMTVGELAKFIAEGEKKLAQYKINRYSKQSKNVREGRSIKRSLAVAKTIMHEKEITHETK
jgi:ribosomal protein L29